MTLVRPQQTKRKDLAASLFTGNVTSTQAIFVVGLIYFISFVSAGISFFKTRGTKIEAKNAAIIKMGAAIADVLTDIFLIFWLHEHENEADNLSTLKWIAIGACSLSFVFGTVCKF